MLFPKVNRRKRSEVVEIVDDETDRVFRKYFVSFGGEDFGSKPTTPFRPTHHLLFIVRSMRTLIPSTVWLMMNKETPVRSSFLV